MYNLGQYFRQNLKNNEPTYHLTSGITNNCYIHSQKFDCLMYPSVPMLDVIEENKKISIAKEDDIYNYAFPVEKFKNANPFTLLKIGIFEASVDHSERIMLKLVNKIEKIELDNEGFIIY